MTIDNEAISVTPEHAFWTIDQDWVEAEDLKVGDRFQTENGTIVDIDHIAEREGDFTVYNFEVEDFHTYYVSELDILVHNANCGLSPNAQRAIERHENIRTNVLGDINSRSGHNHFDAARREALGEVVATRPDGTPFDHVGELQEAHNGLQNVRRAIESEMNNLPSTLTNRGLDVLSRRHSQVQADISRLKGFLSSIGHAP
ncbi:MAG: hypothetical protein F6K09_17675 [Merismopedia sp. SIO2A8]|nr:hypothetical protein [Merismopedia sp. SIO2A8]